jgi:hypothetical protein
MNTAPVRGLSGCRLFGAWHLAVSAGAVAVRLGLSQPTAPFVAPQNYYYERQQHESTDPRLAARSSSSPDSRWECAWVCPLPDRAGTDSVIVPQVARVVLPCSVNENLTPEISEPVGT